MSARPPLPPVMRGPRRRDDDALAVFVRGATVGAFVGAVIAGSTMWRRIRRGIAGGSNGPPRPGAAARRQPDGDPGRPSR